MRVSTTLGLPDRLFACLKARAARERLTLKQLLRYYLEQWLTAQPEPTAQRRSAATMPWLDRPLAMKADQLSNAALFELLEK